MEIAAIGTVADLMPLEGENRVIVSYGIESMGGSRLPGVSALLEISGVGSRSQVTSINVAFAMAPRINASGRLDHAGERCRCSPPRIWMKLIRLRASLIY